MQVKIVTPDVSYFDGEAVEIVLPAWDGEMGVLAGHAPMIARLSHGVARIKLAAGEERIAVYGGFVKVQDNTVTVLAGGAAKRDEGDAAAAARAYQAAKAELQEAKAAGKPAADLQSIQEKVDRARAYSALLSA